MVRQACPELAEGLTPNAKGPVRAELVEGPITKFWNLHANPLRRGERVSNPLLSGGGQVEQVHPSHFREEGLGRSQVPNPKYHRLSRGKDGQL